jgi:hypothetical protein
VIEAGNNKVQRLNPRDANRRTAFSEEDTRMKKLLLAFAVVGLAVASAKSHTVNLYSPAIVGSTELKPGSYTLEVTDSKAVLRNGKVRGEADVKVENNGTRYSTTTVRFTEANGKMKIQEIRLGGTNTKLTFDN